MKFTWSVILMLGCCAPGCTTRTPDIAHTLLITSDFGSVRRCATLDEVHTVARTMISARPDILALDATANGLVNYKSEIGFFVPGSNVDALLEAGLEPFEIIVDTLRRHGVTVLANVRMNDHHGALIQWTVWEREHTQWSLGKDTGARDWKSVGALRQMDYAIEGVRQYRLSILREILERFDVDGLQLDFGRTAPFLSEPKAENARFLTDYVRDIRRLLDETMAKRQRNGMVLGVLVPWDIDFCAQEGLQVKLWIDEGLIDYVSPGEWYYADWNIPLDRWHEITRGTRCKLYPFTPGNVSPFQEFEYGEPSQLGNNRILDPAKIRAIADNFMSQNSDGFAFYNFYVFDFGQYYPDLRTWTNPQQTMQMSKQYLNCRKLMYQPNERETFDLGVAFEPELLQHVGDRVQSPFRFSTDLSQSVAMLRCAFTHMHKGDDVAVRMNGSVLTQDSVKYTALQSEGDATSGVMIWEGTIPPGSLQFGNNVIEWEMRERGNATAQAIGVGEFEIVVEP